jgi:diacylglycerol kinase (ATP)
MINYRVILNPVSGRGEGARSFSLIEAHLNRLALSYSIRLTERPSHAIELAEQAVQEGCDVVVAAGGDGTVNEVVNGLMHAKESGSGSAALGVLSVGRGNDFAFGAGIPHDLEKASQILADNYRQPLDIGHVVGGDYPQGRYFANGIGIGFDAVVGFEALKLKWLHGFPSYLVAALKTIFLYYKAPRISIEYDDQRLELSSLMVSTMNGRRMGGGFLMAPGAFINDTLLDICIANQVSRAQIFALIPLFMKGTQAGNPAIQTLQTRSLVVTALDGSLPAHADGETLCKAGKKLTISIIPRPLEILNQSLEKPA